MMERIDRPQDVQIFPFDGVDSCGVYVGMLDCLESIKGELEWHVDEKASEMCLVPYKYLTLDEIREQVIKKKLYGPMIYVFRYGPLHGDILEYGKQKGYREVVGELVGYA